MEKKKEAKRNLVEKNKLRQLPSVDNLLREEQMQAFLKEHSRTMVTDVVREVLNQLRWEWQQEALGEQEAGEKEGTGFQERDLIVSQIIVRVEKHLKHRQQLNLKPVINATGVILHTNLGRALLGKNALKALHQVATHYSNLELDLATGKRGSRYAHLEELLSLLTGAEASLVVNNNAAAVLLALNTLARDREVIVSRGQLVEIGGSFRIPEVMSQSGAYLREVGTTNKTYPQDYRQAINEKTALLLRVHTSNYRIIGFTQETTLEELVSLGQEKGLPVMEDLGSGQLLDLHKWGLPVEPLVPDSIRVGVDIVTFSGDKLLGGPQAGLIVGKKKYIEPMKKNPLNRALRIDKLTLAALEATLKEYLNQERVIKTIPTLRMLTTSGADLRKKADSLATQLTAVGMEGLEVSVKSGFSTVGGGSMPGTEIPTWLVTLKTSQISAATLAERLRHQSWPVLVRIGEEQIILDVRTVEETEFDVLVEGIKSSL